MLLHSLLQKDREGPADFTRVCYYNLADVRKELEHLPPPWIRLEEKEESLAVGVLQNFMVALHVTIKADLHTHVTVLGTPAPHLNNSIQSVRLRSFLTCLSDMHPCSGVVNPSLQQYTNLPSHSGKNTKHFLHVKYTHMPEGLSNDSCVRSRECGLLCPTGNSTCSKCSELEKTLLLKHNRAEEKEKQPLNPHDSLRSVSKSRLKSALKQERRTAKKYEKELKKFRNTLDESSVSVNEDLHSSMEAIIKKNQPTDELTKLFWKEQQKAFQAKGKGGVRWHPMMIRLALLLHSKGPGAYTTLRETGILKLPGESTLRDYTNFIHPKAGFQTEVLAELRKTSDKLDDHMRYVALLHDEMSIKEDLVFDEKTGELIGFVNIRNWDDPSSIKIASHVLVFYVVGINSSIKTSLCYFATRTATADEMYPLFWEAIAMLETTCKLKVISSTSDKASPNQRLYQLHGCHGELCHKTLNFFAPDRYIYFFSDVPHLIKTVRNNLFRSGFGKTSLLWNDGKYLLWQHIAGAYRADKERHLSRTKLTNEHISLTSHSMMNVRLAAQVLSRSVGLVIQNYGGDESSETAKFILLMDRFFDCLNTRSLDEHIVTSKPDLAPYKKDDDARFEFLDTFERYLNDWKNSVYEREGNFQLSDRAKMFLSHQTFKGILMTIRSFKEATRYLLSEDVHFVLSNKFCQDPLEAHFGRHRSLSRRSENPNIKTFGYQENKIRLQRSLALMIQPKGNVSAKKRPAQHVTISNSPVKKATR